MKFNNAFTDFVRTCLKAKTIPFLLGEPGIGKSSWIETLAKDMHTRCFVVACNQLGDVADLTGARPIKDTDTVTNKDGTVSYVENGEWKQTFFPHITIHDAIKYAESHPRETPILFLDEINRTTSDITSALLSLPTARKIGDKTLPPNLQIIIAGNNKGNITVLDSASITRFVPVTVEPDASTFLALDQNLNPFIRQTLEEHPECIFCKTLMQTTADDDDDEDGGVDINEILDDGEQMEQFTTPRTISALSRFLNECPQDKLLEYTQLMDTLTPEPVCYLASIIQAFTGKTAFSAFLLEKILSSVMNMSATNTNNGKIAKPQCYDELKRQTTIDELNNYINGMDNREKSGCLAYALFEREDNSIIIKALAAVTPALESEDLKALMKVAASDDGLDEENAKTLADTGTTLANTISLLLNV